MRVRIPFWALLVAFVVVPLLEIYVIIQVGEVIGPWWTILLLLGDSLFGAWLVKHEGRRAWRALVEALGAGHMPARELADGVLILVGGTLMIAPGFITDIVGTVLILPFTRPLGRRLLSGIIGRRLLTPRTAPETGRRSGYRASGHEQPDSEPRVVRGDVVD